MYTCQCAGRARSVWLHAVPTRPAPASARIRRSRAKDCAASLSALELIRTGEAADLHASCSAAATAARADAKCLHLSGAVRCCCAASRSLIVHRCAVPHVAAPCILKSQCIRASRHSCSTLCQASAFAAQGGCRCPAASATCCPARAPRAPAACAAAGSGHPLPWP